MPLQPATSPSSAAIQDQGLLPRVNYQTQQGDIVIVPQRAVDIHPGIYSDRDEDAGQDKVEYDEDSDDVYPGIWVFDVAHDTRRRLKGRDVRGIGKAHAPRWIIDCEHGHWTVEV